MWWSPFLIKLQASRLGTLLKRDSNTGAFLWNHSILLSFVLIRFITGCHLLLLIVMFCYSLSIVVTCCTTHCHSLLFIVPLVVIRCHSLSHSLSFVVHRCATDLLFYKWSLCIPQEIQSAFCLYLQKALDFLMEFCSSDPSFNRVILRSLYLKCEISGHAPIAITHYYVLFTNLLRRYEFETYIGDTFW